MFVGNVAVLSQICFVTKQLKSGGHVGTSSAAPLESQTEVLAQQHPAGHDIAAHADSQKKTIPAQQHRIVRNIELHVESQTEAIPAQ